MFTLKRAEFYVVLVFLFLMMIASVSAQEFAGGSGTEADPWQIETHVHLNNVRNYLGSDHSDKYFIQTADIDLYDATREGGIYWNDGEGWEPIGWYVAEDDNDPFYGKYNGAGHVIDNLFINRLDGDYQGLFGYISDSLIKNLGLEDTIITGKKFVGSLAGATSNNSTINNCYATGSLIGTELVYTFVGGLVGLSLFSNLMDSFSACDVNGDGLIGGLVGKISSSSVMNSYSISNVTGTGSWVGGLIGCSSQTSIVQSCYSRGSVTGNFHTGGLIGCHNYSSLTDKSYSFATVNGVTGYFGGLIGYNLNSATVNNSFSAGSVVGDDNFRGGLVGRNDLTGTVSNSYWNIETSGQTTSAGGAGAMGRTTAEMTYPYAVNTYVDWDFEEIWMPDVTYIINEGYPFLIDTISITEIPNHATNHNPMDGENSVLPHASLSWEVDFEDNLLNLPTGFRISLGTDYPPTNLINELDIGYTHYFTPEVPFLVNEIHYWQVIPYNNVGDALDCPIWSFTTDSFAGGSGTEADPWQIETHVHLNNVRNYLGSDHSDKYFIQTADIDLYDATREGGVYWNNGEGWDPIGWYASQGSSHFYGNYDGTGHIIDYLYINRADDHYQGLFSVIDEATISNLGITNTDITAYRIIGSLAGYAGNSSVFNCFSSGICTGIHATDTKVGGLIGATGQHSTISNCYSNSEVSGPSRIGGLVGQNQSNSTIIHSISSGIVSGSGYGFGGLVGNNSSNAIVSNSFSSSSVIGYSRVGGLVGFNYEDAIVVDSYSTGSVTGTGYVGGLIGRPGGTVINSYWDIETSGQTTSPMGEGRTTTEMTYPYATNTYVDWDFDDIWAEDNLYVMNNGYPYLNYMTHPSLILLSPSGGEVWQGMTTKTVYWYPNMDIDLDIMLSFNDGTSWTYLNSVSVSSLTGSFSFTVPAFSSDACLIKIASTEFPNQVYDVSNSAFTITTTVPPSVSLVSPDSNGLKLHSGRDVEITWSSHQVNNVDLDISYDNGLSWNSIGENISAAQNSYIWQVSDVFSTTCYFRISDSQNLSNYDWSNHLFTIGELEMLRPYDNEEILAGTEYQITWLSSNVESIDIKYSVDEGENWITEESSYPTQSGSYIWTIPELSGSEITLRLSDSDHPSIKVEANLFAATLQVTFPNAEGLKLQKGSVCTITWYKENITSELIIEFSNDGGNSFSEIAAGVDPHAESFDWLVPDIETTAGRIKISLSDNTDSNVVSEHSFMISMLELVNPNGGEVWIYDTIQTISWSHYNIDNVKLEYSVSNGDDWQEIIGSTNAENGNYNWLVPDVYSEQCLVRVSDADNEEIFDLSDDVFTIRPQIILSHPIGGETFLAFTMTTLHWDATTEVTNVYLDYTIDAGENWLPIISQPYPAANGSYDWIVPNTPTENALVRVRRADDHSITAISEDVFIIIDEVLPPVVDFTADTVFGVEPLTVQFTDQSQPGVGSIISWDWDFGDGETSNEQHPLHIYENSGLFSVILAVTNQFDSSSSLTIEDYITVLPDHPEIALLTPASINFGSVNVAEQSAYHPIVVRNTGGATLTITEVSFIGEPFHFERVYNLTRNILIESTEQDTIYVRFTPQTVGTLVDTLFIYSNAVNQPLLSIRLQGTGLYVPPKAPENVQITMDGYDAVITWDPVTENEHNEPIEPDFYIVFYNGSNDVNGQYYYHGDTYETQYVHSRVGMFADHMFYRVKAIKIYEPPAVRSDYREYVQAYLEENLKEGMTEAEVTKILEGL